MSLKILIGADRVVILAEDIDETRRLELHDEASGLASLDLRFDPDADPGDLARAVAAAVRLPVRSHFEAVLRRQRCEAFAAAAASLSVVDFGRTSSPDPDP